MTVQSRFSLPAQPVANGGSENPWWANTVVYQIYPRSFQDSNNDGIGDIPGIISRLDYLEELGVDAIWLSPVLVSPQDDNGYDISDYYDIDPMFGTLADMDDLIQGAHQRGIKVIMDLVVNHTSDEHAWFEASRRREAGFEDWYWWRPAKPGMAGGEKWAEPNAWGSYFGGSAWQWDEVRGEYFLHQFSRKQPDLNWENPAVRQAVYQMMNWWMDRGIDGFRMDVITLISKHLGEDGSLPAGEIGPSGYADPAPYCSDGPRLDEFLKEMHQAVFANRSGYLNVGEAPGIFGQRLADITNPDNKELDMLFVFDHVGIDHGPDSKFDVIPWRVADLRNCLAAQQAAVAEKGWNSLFFNNHDQPRALSRWGDDSTPRTRFLSASALATVLHLHRGTPYIYQGEELGMTNAGFERIEQYRDLESINLFHQRVEESREVSAEQMMAGLAAMSRDNSRTPMQWSSGENAGFTSGQPWIEVNPNCAQINAADERADEGSVWHYYRRLIALRHTDAVVALGAWELLDEQHEYIYAFSRTLGEERYFVAVNLSGENQVLGAQCRQGLMGAESEQIVLSNYGDLPALGAEEISLRPWEALVWRLR